MHGSPTARPRISRSISSSTWTWASGLGSHGMSARGRGRWRPQAQAATVRSQDAGANIVEEKRERYILREYSKIRKNETVKRSSHNFRALYLDLFDGLSLLRSSLFPGHPLRPGPQQPCRRPDACCPEVVIHQIDEELAAARVRPGVGHGNGVASFLFLRVNSSLMA